MSSIDTIFGAKGKLAATINAYAPRIAQIEMAKKIEQGLEKNQLLIVEAGTGTGKTFAYLVPAILAGQKVLISTGTKHLQDQIFIDDLPKIRNVIGMSVNIALLKGRANYLCHFRLHKNAEEARLSSREHVIAFNQIMDWSQRTIKGDISELADIAEGSPVWPLVTSNADNCLGSDCPDIDRCCVVEARKEAQKADIVVINHHLFFADLALQEESINDLLPSSDSIIFDEAHHLPEIASRFFGKTVSFRQLHELIHDVLEAIEDEASDLLATVKKYTDELLFSSQQIRILLKKLPNRGPWFAFNREPKIVESISECQKNLIDLQKYLKKFSERGKQLELCSIRCDKIVSLLNEMIQIKSNQIQWYETTDRNFFFHTTPLDVADKFREPIEKFKSVVLTSATLSVENDFSYFVYQLGLEKAICYAWDSPFNYSKNTLLYFPKKMPDPSSDNFVSKLINHALEILSYSKGRAFLLFTSHRSLQEAAHLLEKSPYPLFIQGSKPKRVLLNEFRKSGNGVLLGTTSFWEGVDIRGDALSCVMIDKLPFASPGDPVTSARLTHFRESGLDPFKSYQLPQAVISMKQGVGRLIRDFTDRGVMVIFDPRIQSRFYGRTFLHSLPPMPITQNITDVQNFYDLEEPIEASEA